MARTTSARGDAKTNLAARLAARVDDNVDIHLGDPRDKSRNYIIVGDVDGTVEYRLLQAGRKRRKDTFTITCWCIAAAPGMTPEEADAAALALYAAIEDDFADDPTQNLEGVNWAGVSQVHGPYNNPTDQGYVAAIRCDVEFNCEYS